MPRKTARKGKNSPESPDRDTPVAPAVVKPERIFTINMDTSDFSKEEEEEWEDWRAEQIEAFKRESIGAFGYGAAWNTLSVFADFLARSGRVPADPEHISDIVYATGDGFEYLESRNRPDIEWVDWDEIMETEVYPHEFFYNSTYVEVELAKGNAPHVDFGVPPSPEYFRWFQRYLELMDRLCPVAGYSFRLDDLPDIIPLWESDPAPWDPDGASYLQLEATHDFYWLLTAAAQRFGAGVDRMPPEQVAEILLELDARDPTALNLDIFAPIATARRRRQEDPTPAEQGPADA